MSISNYNEIRALVTGANRGIGRAFVEVLLDNGAAKVYAAARNTSSLEALKASAGDRLELITLDVTNLDQVQAAAEVAQDANVLVNNAGIAFMQDLFAEDALANARTEMEVNYFGPLTLAQAFKDTLVGNQGAILNVSSVGGLANFPMAPTYSASKAAIHSLTQGLRTLLKPAGVHVAGVYPGPIDTDMAKDIEMGKTSPRVVAEHVFAGLFAGADDIFPDPMAEGFGSTYHAAPKDAERMFAEGGEE